jgi:hypothetical protein
LDAKQQDADGQPGSDQWRLAWRQRAVDHGVWPLAADERRPTRGKPAGLRQVAIAAAVHIARSSRLDPDGV